MCNMKDKRQDEGDKVEQDAKLGGWPVGGDPLPLNDDDGGVLDSLWKSTHQGQQGKMKTASQTELTRTRTRTREQKKSIMLSCQGEDGLAGKEG